MMATRALATELRRGDGRRGDALLLATDGTVLEDATSNVRWRRGDVLRTPGLETGILPGVTRVHLLRLAPGAGYRVEEGAWPLDGVLAADEVILSSSVREVVGVIGIDGRAIADGRPGPGAAALQAGLRAEASKGPEARIKRAVVRLAGIDAATCRRGTRRT